MAEREPGPQVVWLVRHGESMGNVADARAQSAKAGRLELDVRDPDVPLSDTGRSQAEALGKWLAELPEDERPTAALSSPFNRALTTAQLATAGLDVRVRTDERLLIVAHQAVIMVFRYVLEELTEQELLEVDREEQVANASLTRYDRDADGNLRLTTFNEVEHLTDEDEEVTEEPDAAPQH